MHPHPHPLSFWLFMNPVGKLDTVAFDEIVKY
jgi:hypothetical protein